MVVGAEEMQAAHSHFRLSTFSKAARYSPSAQRAKWSPPLLSPPLLNHLKETSIGSLLQSSHTVCGAPTSSPKIQSLSSCVQYLLFFIAGSH